ncbi:hypothetical protein ACWPK4_001830 [Campylobacter coli]|nr:alpha-2,3-sialyltransferase [Campylobacter coli]EDO6651423.1 alpha-2,3-sialyltransferase [Campylobacter coli]EDO6652605.1 alpha-2,3-sialyltransferase [Campylobacter coli]
MSKEIQEFVEKLKDWKNNFPIQEYDYTKYDCEVANIAKWQKENNINELINFWNEKCKNDYFELKHPVYNDVITRAVNNYFDNGVRNYVFMIDKNNKYPWILLQDSHLINSCILPNKIFKIFSYWNFWGNLDEIRNILLENDKNFFYNAFPFAFLLGNSLPQHYFTQVFASLYAISNHTILNKNLSSPAFFVLKEHKKQIKNDEKLIYIYPNLNGNIRATFDLACKKIYNDSLLYPGIYYQKDNSEYDLKVWFGFPSTPYRDWIEKYQFATLFIENCSLYFKKIKIYVDGITAYEGERIDDERNNAVYKILKEQIVKVCKNKNIDCTLFHLAGYDYRTKICYCNDCDIAISEGNTTALVPFNFCKISGVNFIPFTPWSARVGSKIVSFKDMARVYTDINKADGLSSYHIPPQHIYNLAAEVLEELSVAGKLKIKNLKMDRLDVPPVELIAKQYELEQTLKIKLPIESVALYSELEKQINALALRNNTTLNQALENINTNNALSSTLQHSLQTKDQTIQNLENKIKDIEFKLYFKTAKARIQNHLAYKLGSALIENSKSIFGYIRMPYVLSYIRDKHRLEQKRYEENIKRYPELTLPPLESYPDYKEALKEKECFTYKLGEALIRADKEWYKGGYIKLWFEIRKLKKEFGKK